jgi:hypothetical protein
VTRQHLQINAPGVVHETIDGETILIHLGTGVYYSLDGVGAEIWSLVIMGADQHEIVADLRTRYDADEQTVVASAAALVGQLLDEGLLVAGELNAPPASDEHESESSATASVASATLPFLAPVLAKYTDMQEFMLADPLHDVEESAGWPHVKQG